MPIRTSFPDLQPALFHQVPSSREYITQDNMGQQLKQGHKSISMPNLKLRRNLGLNPSLSPRQRCTKNPLKYLGIQEAIGAQGSPCNVTWAPKVPLWFPSRVATILTEQHSSLPIILSQGVWDS